MDKSRIIFLGRGNDTRYCIACTAHNLVNDLSDNPICYLHDGTLSDGYLLTDRVHRIRPATNCLMANMQLLLHLGETSATYSQGLRYVWSAHMPSPNLLIPTPSPTTHHCPLSQQAASTEAWMISEGERRHLYLRNQVTETTGLVTIQILYNCIYLLLTIARLARWCVMNIVFVLELMFVSYTLHHFLYLSLYRCQYVPFCVHLIHVIIHLVILIWQASLHLYHFYFHMEYLHRFTWLLYFFVSIFTVHEALYPICVLLRMGQ